jgi:hypothetical protein
MLGMQTLIRLAMAAEMTGGNAKSAAMISAAPPVIHSMLPMVKRMPLPAR